MLTTIGFFSIGTPYEREAKTLAASLDRVGMKRLIVGFEDRGSWYENTAAKADLIREARHTLNGPLLYIDVDAFVHSNCAPYFEKLAAEGYDFGVHYFAGPAKGKNRNDVCRCVRRGYGKCDKEHRLLSGTLFFGDTEGARRLCDAWVEKNAALRAEGITEGGGQKNLWRTTVEIGDTLKIAKLPGRYCRVFDKDFAYPRKEPVVIEHTIASRENRDTVRVNPGRRRRITELQDIVR